MKPTHVVVGIPENNSFLKQCVMLGDLRPEMDVIAWCNKRSDAEVVRRTFQVMDKDHNREFFVIERKDKPATE